MRNITSQAIAAFEYGKNFKSGNTEVQSGDYITHLLLHGNAIARVTHDNGLEINLCGWNTPTTRERLSGLPSVSVTTKKGQAFLNGVAIPSIGWVKVG